MGQQLYFGEVHAGDRLEPFARKTELMNFNRFAAVNDEFVPVHMDSEAAKANGFPKLYGMGALRKALMHVAAREWAGEDGEVERVVVQHRAVNFRDEVLTFTATVKSVSEQDRGGRVQLDVEARNDDGVLSAAGSVTMTLPSATPPHRSMNDADR